MNAFTIYLDQSPGILITDGDVRRSESERKEKVPAILGEFLPSPIRSKSRGSQIIDRLIQFNLRTALSYTNVVLFEVSSISHPRQ